MIIAGRQLQTGVRATLGGGGARAAIRTLITGQRVLQAVEPEPLTVTFDGGDEVMLAVDAEHILGLWGTTFSATFTGVTPSGGDLSAALCTILEMPEFEPVGRGACRYRFVITILQETP